MYKNKRVLSVIIARGGSKGLPGKNTMLIGGRPMIAWSIDAAVKSAYTDRHILSTDDPAIRDIAVEHGAFAPFIRPDELATDESKINQVIEHAVSFLAEEGELFDLVVILQATSPLRLYSHIDEAIEKLVDSARTKKTTLVSVCRAELKVQWLLHESEEGYINFVFPEGSETSKRQELEQYFLPNGAIYIVPSGEISNGIYNETTCYYEMPREQSIDIDTIEDFELAQQALKTLHKSL